MAAASRDWSCLAAFAFHCTLPPACLAAWSHLHSTSSIFFSTTLERMASMQQGSNDSHGYNQPVPRRFRNWNSVRRDTHTSFAPDLDAMAGSILVLGVPCCRHEKQLRLVAVDALRETKLAPAGSMAAAAACLRNLPSFTALCSAMHKANHPQASEEERQRTATG